MQYSSLLAAAAAIAVAQAADLTNSAYGVTAGQPFTITWTGASGQVTLLLKSGSSGDLKTVSTIGSGLSGTSYTWSVPSDIVSNIYAIEIDDSAGANYSPQFAAGSGSASTSASASVSGSTSASASISASSTSGSTSSGSTLSTTASSSSKSSTITTSASTSTSSLISSIVSNSTTSASSTTGSSNSTTTAKSTGSSSTTGSTKTPTSSSSTGTGSTVPNANSATQFASPLALVFLTIAAVFSLN